MALSPNYGWAEPDNSSLVKNGAQDIRALGDAIDTSVWNVGYGQAGKNKLINGDFNINQRAFTSSTTDGAYGFDRWLMEALSGATYSAQTFTAGAAPVAGYESKNFARIATTGQSGAGVYTLLEQKIEDVRTFAGQTVTVSFWAKAASAGAKIGIELSQSFGSGGSAQVNTALGAVTLTTGWVRYSASVAVPSISGKTIGTADSLTLGLWTSAGTTFATRASSIGIQTATIDFWGVQVEYGSKMTPFQTASGGSPQAELAMCQRYFQKRSSYVSAPCYDGTNDYFFLNLPVSPTMRVSPTLGNVSVSTIQYVTTAGTLANTNGILTSGSINGDTGYVIATITALGTTGFAASINTTDITFGAEL
jgi:hypothetical protein